MNQDEDEGLQITEIGSEKNMEPNQGTDPSRKELNINPTGQVPIHQTRIWKMKTMHVETV
jgi:hypothetical protein